MPKRQHRSVYKKQPAMQVMWEQRWTVPRAAEAIGVPRNHLAAVLYGRVVPSPAVRERLPILLGTPIEKLLDADLLAREFQYHRPPKPYRPRASKVRAS